MRWCNEFYPVLGLLCVLSLSHGFSTALVSVSPRSSTPRGVRNRESRSPCSMSSVDIGGAGSDGLNRKEFGALAAAALVSLLSGPSVAAGGEKRTVVLTGANSGIGLDAAKKLVSLGHDVHLACRTKEKAAGAVAASGATAGYECDLASLESVRAFAKAWGSKPIDSLCLNAGVAPSTDGKRASYTREGFELAVGTNHLGHFLLANMLVKPLEAGRLNRSRLVVTASSVHDPDTPGGDVGSKATLGDLSGLEGYLKTGHFDMVDGGAYDGDKTYKDSKLCNVLFTREAQRRLSSAGSKVVATCFSPGLITSTGLFRNQNPAFVKAFDFAATNVLKLAASVSQGGGTLAQIAQDPSMEGVPGGQFFATAPGKPGSPFAPREVSVEARDAAKGQRLWSLSAQCVGLGSKTPI